MNEIDLWHEAENFEHADEGKFKDIACNLYKFFEWSDNPTSEEKFDEIYNRVIDGEDFDKIIKEKTDDSNR